jgi:hypothetical protein
MTVMGRASISTTSMLQLASSPISLRKVFL